MKTAKSQMNHGAKADAGSLIFMEGDSIINECMTVPVWTQMSNTGE